MAKNFDRKEYNYHLLDKTIELIKKEDAESLIEALVNTCYLIEQVIKKIIFDKNPLLYYDHRGLNNPTTRAQNASGVSPNRDIKSINFSDAVSIYLAIHKKSDSLSSVLDRLRTFRNEIEHSIADIEISSSSIGDVSAKALIEMKPFMILVCGERAKNIEVDTYKDLLKRQLELQKISQVELKRRLKYHLSIFNKMNRAEVIKRLRQAPQPGLKGTSFDSWDSTSTCPACKQCSLDEMSFVDFDWNPDGTLIGEGKQFVCRVCELVLDEYELSRTLL